MRNHWELVIKIEKLLKTMLELQSKEEATGQLGGIFEADAIMNKSGFAAITSSITPYYINSKNNDDRQLINDFINKYSFLPTLSEDDYWDVLEDAIHDYEDLLNKLNVIKVMKK